jgi:hypothetical protein
MSAHLELRPLPRCVAVRRALDEAELVLVGGDVAGWGESERELPLEEAVSVGRREKGEAEVMTEGKGIGRGK